MLIERRCRVRLTLQFSVMTKGSERQYILKILEDIQTKQAFMNKVIDDYFFVYDFDKQQRSFIARVVYGTIEHQNYIDFCINHVSSIKINKMKPTIRGILRMSVYQILFMDKVPAHAAINEAVKLTQKRKFTNLKSFVNGVLRNVERQKQGFPELIKQLPEAEYLSVQYSLNHELTTYLLSQYSFDALEKFLIESQREKETCVRTNILKLTTADLKEKLLAQCEIRDGNLFKDSFYIRGYDQLNVLEPFINGEFQVQDESSTLVGIIANLNKSSNVIDVCAAPGGKTTHMAMLMENAGRIVACDISETKTHKIQENCERLSLSNVTIITQDATIKNDDFIQAFDTVIADVPCSGLGVFRSKPDIKHNMTREKISRLIEIQKSILQNVKDYVKVDGVLIYSTCTINKDENANQIDGFLKDNPSFVAVDLMNEPQLNGLIKSHIKDKYLQLLTDEQVTDGFFIAKLKRIQE